MGGVEGPQISCGFPCGAAAGNVTSPTLRSRTHGSWRSFDWPSPLSARVHGRAHSSRNPHHASSLTVRAIPSIAECGHRRRRCAPRENCAFLPETQPRRMAQRPPIRRSSGDFSLRAMCIMCKIGASPAVALKQRGFSADGELRVSAVERKARNSSRNSPVPRIDGATGSPSAGGLAISLCATVALFAKLARRPRRGEYREVRNPSRNCANPATCSRKTLQFCIIMHRKSPRWVFRNEPAGSRRSRQDSHVRNYVHRVSPSERDSHNSRNSPL